MILPGLFVVGTDTGVGKTVVASAIARSWRRAGHRVGVLKPVASGATVIGNTLLSDDTRLLLAAIGGEVPPERVSPIVFEEPLAPPVAAQRAGNPLAFGDVLKAVEGCLIWWADRADVMVVEGVGGLLCPLAEGNTVADLAIALDYPLIIVAHRGLGTLNHSLLTIEAARSRGLRIAGLILNGARPTVDPIAEATNVEELTERAGGVAILANWRYREEFSPDHVAPEAMDWYDLARPSRRQKTGEPLRVGAPISGLSSLR